MVAPRRRAARAFSRATAAAASPSSSPSFLSRLSALAAAALAPTTSATPPASPPVAPAPAPARRLPPKKPYKAPVNPFKHLGPPQRKTVADASRPAQSAAVKPPSSQSGSTQVTDSGTNDGQPKSHSSAHAESSAQPQVAAAEKAQKVAERPVPRPKKIWQNLAHLEGAVLGRLSGLDVSPETVTPLREMHVATLAHGLDRVLFNPGVHWLRDPRTGIYNFPPSLRNILDPDLFDYDALPPYITSSQDKELETIAKKNEARYCGSTSSMTALLSQCYFLISGRKNPDLSGFSESFKALGNGFTMGAQLPASIKLMRKPNHDGSKEVYAIDADKAAAGELDNSNFVLAALGKSMEKMLTVDDNEFRNFERTERWTRLSKGEVDPPAQPEAYHYSKLSKFMMRSQLDCYDSRLPNKTFDLKTRAVVAIRQDRANWVESSGYQIRSAKGLLESFEREYYDMVRAAFLKYGFQARIGNMDGIFVAYHNTKEIFGFQYVPLEEIFTRVFGTVEMGEQAFSLSVRLLEKILDSATEIYEKQSLRLTLVVGEGKDPSMNVFVEPYDEKAASQSQPVSQPSNADSTSIPDPFGTPIEKVIDSSNKPFVPLSQRKIVQLDVKVDRWLDGNMVHGVPVDFTSPPGRAVNSLKEDEIARRSRQKLGPLQWDVDYVIQPRGDLTEAETNRHLNVARAAQLSVSSLTMPNLDAVATREAELEERMRQYGGEEAVERWRSERRDGRIGRMPRAPGQKPLSGLEGTEEEAVAAVEGEADGGSEGSVAATSEDGESAAGAAEAASTSQDDAAAAAAASRDLPHISLLDRGEGLWTTRLSALRRVQHLRELARLGAQDRVLQEKSDRKEQV
ncbi:unnamed protein product [Tilletia controversa]|uniref:Pet127-domain-containing protein n=3 Tax=Tilletia TaxID=13289 RepID=A0A8X7SUB2_9BASI|nr:hypothetical protein CF336_g6276 [Tilletia laevis]KAE8190414.1 hypothetical protein CF328_g5980 [Tilletia controversa]KAE8253699.1 hypothetical protein A4X03_0g5821 [Tilletia caries]KAE8193216.1 hypothetical protein CF335_g5650 [Tilletia laevis]KAE8242702.1 hypothetical protein A4X06_0g6791 [Tilletia controversa]